MKIIFSSIVSITFFLLVFTLVNSHYASNGKSLGRQGPVVRQTNGEPWPKPQLVAHHSKRFMKIRPTLFQFKVVKNSCDILEQALKRYYKIISGSGSLLKKYRKISANEDRNNEENTFLDVLNIHLIEPCEYWPSENMDETYEIRIDSPDYSNQGMLVAMSIWGMLRGLETFTQLLHPNPDFTSLIINSVLVVDYPRFPFRSLLIDSARHFLPKKLLFDTLDLMAMNKLNVLHWHIVDDSSFPFQSTTFPILSEKGAYHPYTHVYTKEDVKEVVHYARTRGIRVIPEFDTPGHTQSWAGIPNLLTECYDESSIPDGTYGPIDPTLPANFKFLKDFFSEIFTTFPDSYVHLGGDEVDFSCWRSNPAIQEFMKTKNYSDYGKLEGYYMRELIETVKEVSLNKSYVVWQEVIDNDLRSDKEAIVHIWKNNLLGEEMANITSLGFRVLLSACWYLDHITYGPDWHEYYKCDPHDFEGTDAQKRLVLGGGAAMWGEYIDGSNLIQRTWPRASVPAERLWSSSKVNDTVEAGRRLEEHRCRLIQRGYDVEPPNGAGFCLT